MGVVSTGTLRKRVIAPKQGLATCAAQKAGEKLRRFAEFYEAAASWDRVERIIARIEAGPLAVAGSDVAIPPCCPGPPCGLPECTESRATRPSHRPRTRSPPERCRWQSACFARRCRNRAASGWRLAPCRSRPAPAPWEPGPQGVERPFGQAARLRRIGGDVLDAHLLQRTPDLGERRLRHRRARLRRGEMVAAPVGVERAEPTV